MPRRELDRYLTRRSWDVEQLLKRVDIRGHVMELCAGEGDIVRVLNKQSNFLVYPTSDRIFTNDLDPLLAADYHADATDPLSYVLTAIPGDRLPSVDWHVTNPPYNLAPKIIPLAFEHARVGIAMLLRLTYLEPCTRSRRKDAIRRGFWLRDHPPTDLIILPRYSYTGDGKTDSVTSAWMVWDKRKGVGIVQSHEVRNQRIFCVPEEEEGGSPQ